MTCVFDGTPEQAMTAFFDHLRRAQEGDRIGACAGSRARARSSGLAAVDDLPLHDGSPPWSSLS
jgi:hypothetical protein